MGLGNLFGGGSVAKLQVEVAANTQGLKQGLSDAKKQVKDAARGFGQLGSLASVGLVAAGVQAGKMYIELSKVNAAQKRLITSSRDLAARYGQSYDSMMMKLREASGRTIDDTALMIQANKALELGAAKDADQLAQLLEVARAKARETGYTTQQAFGFITTAVGRMSPQIADNLNILMDANTRYTEYGKTIGKTADQLTEFEKRQAIATGIISEGAESVKNMKDAGDDAIDAIDGLNTAWSNFKTTIGDSKWLKNAALGLTDLLNVVAGSGPGATQDQKRQAIQSQIDYRQRLLADPIQSFGMRGILEDEIKELEAQLARLNSAFRMADLGTGMWGAGWNGIAAAGGSTQPAYVPGKGNRGLDEGWGAGGYIGPTVGPGVYIKNFGEELGDATTATKNYTSAITSGLSTIKGLMSPTSVTRLDELETKHGVYQNKWDEPMRRVQDVINRGAESPWAQQYFGNLQGEELEMRALQFQRDWGMGLYNQLPLSQDDRSIMQAGLGQAWWQKESGEAQQTQLAGDVYKEYGEGIGSAFGTVWDDTVKELAIGKPVIEKLIQDIEADSAILNTAGGKLWTELLTGIDASDVNALELLINHIAPGMAQWLSANGYLPGLN